MMYDTRTLCSKDMALASLKKQLPSALIDIARQVQESGGQLYLVGGVVRDAFLGATAKDFDLEVFNLDYSELERILGQFGQVQEIGKAFSVLQLILPKGMRVEFALARLERKIGKGHRGFAVDTNSDLTFAQAAYRRDFTINALGISLPQFKLEDPYAGLKDLALGSLKHVSPAFSEDPLRALRAMQFIARFSLEITPETLALCASQDLSELPKERIFAEFKKLFLQAKRPSFGLRYLQAANLLRFFPEILALVNVPQDPIWHPEGCVFTHTLMVVDEAAEIAENEISEYEHSKRLKIMFAALCHDFGKAKTTAFIEGKWRSLAHDIAGEEPTRNFLMRLCCEQQLIEGVVALVREHLRPAQLYKDKENIKDSTIRRLSLRVPINELLLLAKADHFGRTTKEALERKFQEGEWLRERAEQLDVSDKAPKAWILGRDLIALGFAPGKEMGNILALCFEKQLEGEHKNRDDILYWLKEQKQKNSF